LAASHALSRSVSDSQTRSANNVSQPRSVNASLVRSLSRSLSTSQSSQRQKVSQVAENYLDEENLTKPITKEPNEPSPAAPENNYASVTKQKIPGIKISNQLVDSEELYATPPPLPPPYRSASPGESSLHAVSRSPRPATPRSPRPATPRSPRPATPRSALPPPFEFCDGDWSETESLRRDSYHDVFKDYIDVDKASNNNR